MIVVTTPTGAIGRQVLDTLLAGAEPLRVVVRDASRLPPAVRARVAVIEGSHGDPAIVDRAFEGADAVFWLLPPNLRAPSVEGAYIGFSRPACEAFRRQGVKHVVGVSALGRGVAAHAGLVSASLAMDDLIAGSGVAYRALAMPSFMDNMLRQVASIRDQGVFFSTLSGDRKAPTCATRDIAAVGARLLADRSWTGRADVPVLGPEDLSQNDMAAILSDVLGKPVRFQRIPLEAYKAQFLSYGASEAMAQGMIDMMDAKEHGLDTAALRTADGTTPTSFRQWCEEVLKPAVRAGR